VRNGRAVTTDADWAVGNAELIDAAFAAAPATEPATG